MNEQKKCIKKRIILHVGLHKTASTYIQETLAESRQSLRSQGWNYPLYSNGKKKGLSNHSNLLYTLFSENTNFYVPNIQSRTDAKELFNIYDKTLKSELMSDYNLILSGEDVSALSLASLHKLAKALEPYDFIVIAFVRESYSYLCSNLQHRIHRGIHGLKIEGTNLSQNCYRLKEAFPDIKFFSYEKVKAEKNGFINVFSGLCNITIKPTNKKSANVSLGNKTIRFLAEFNLNYPLIIEDNRLNPDRPSFNVKRLDFDKKKFLLTKSEFRTIAKKIREENKKLRLCTGLEMIRIEKPIPFADDSDLTWNEAMDLLIKTTTMPTTLAYRALIYVLQQRIGLKLYRIIRPFLNILLFRNQIIMRLKKLISQSSAKN